MNTYTTFLFLFLLAVARTTLLAQSSDTIIPNPNAVQLRKVWEVTGRPLQYDQVGYRAAALPDLTGDSINEFAVYKGSTSQWFIYPGSNQQLQMTPWRVFDSVTESPAIGVGDFFGSGHPCLAFSHYFDSTGSDGIRRFPYQLWIYRIDSGLQDTPQLILDPRTSDPTLMVAIRGIQGIDLDNDSIDELILRVDGSRRGMGTWQDTGEVWIYKGGKDFQVKQPTAIIASIGGVDQGTLNVSFVHLDGDRKLDMVIGARQAGGARLKFYFSDDNSPYSWATRPPDREILLLPNNGIAITTPPFFINLDGDSIADVLGKVFTGQNIGIYLYLSRSGKPMTSRSYAYDDADVIFHTVYGRLPAMGSLNDSLQRYDMLPLIGISPHRGAALLALSGGRTGPNRSYDAWFPDDDESFFARAQALQDVTGDGWRDYLGANERWGAFVDQGIAMVLSGGPYIPTDDPTVSVQELPVAGKQAAISLWPNPVCERLSIAWRGDLTHMPHRFELHDLSGRYIAGGTTEPSLGSVVWQRGDTPAGAYFLTAFDDSGGVIATANIILQ